MALGETGIPAVPASPYGSASAYNHPPHPETYTFSQRSTRKATGEIFGFGAAEPKVVEYTKSERSGFSLATNCFAPTLIKPTLAVVFQSPVVDPITYGNPFLSNSIPYIASKP